MKQASITCRGTTLFFADLGEMANTDSAYVRQDVVAKEPLPLDLMSGQRLIVNFVGEQHGMVKNTDLGRPSA
jgi:hypothetical protein